MMKNVLAPHSLNRYHGYNCAMATWRANFFDDWDDLTPARSMIISGNSEEEIVEEAECGMRDAVRLEFIPLNSELRSRD